MSLRSHDFAIIGAGIMGSALALELAMRGRDVLLVDRVGICAGSTRGAPAVSATSSGTP